MSDTKTIEDARKKAVSKACSDLIGASDPFGAIQWMRTLPKDWQPEIHEIITYVYHHEKEPPWLQTNSKVKDKNG